MYTCPIQLTDVTYNAATQQFEAVVRVHDNAILRSYACALHAPLTMPFEQAARGLAKQALRRHNTRDGLISLSSSTRPSARMGTLRAGTMRWLHSLAPFPDHRAA